MQTACRGTVKGDPVLANHYPSVGQLRRRVCLPLRVVHVLHHKDLCRIWSKIQRNAHYPRYALWFFKRLWNPMIPHVSFQSQRDCMKMYEIDPGGSWANLGQNPDVWNSSKENQWRYSRMFGRRKVNWERPPWSPLRRSSGYELLFLSLTTPQ